MTMTNVLILLAAPLGLLAQSETVTIRKGEIAGIAVANTASVDGQKVRLEALSARPGFRSGLVLKSRDGQHVVLYTEWQSEAALTAADPELGCYGVAYLGVRGGGDKLVVDKTRAILINVILTDPERIDKLYEFWVRGAENYWLKQDEVIGAALHRAADNRSVINIATWTSGEAWFEATRHAGENFAGAHGVGTSDPKLYEIVAVK